MKTLHPCTQLFFFFFVEIYKITNTRENVECMKRKERHMTENSVLFYCSSNCTEMRKAKIVYSPVLWLSAASLRVTTVKNLNSIQNLSVQLTLDKRSTILTSIPTSQMQFSSANIMIKNRGSFRCLSFAEIYFPELN